MKIVDKRWRLFGVINIFDLLVLCVIASLALFYFAWMTIAEDPSFVKSETIHVKCKGISNMPDYIARLVKEGDIMVGETGDVICRIEKILSVAPMAQVVYQSKDGEKIFSASDQVKVAMLFDLTVYKRQSELYFENLGCPVIVGGFITIKTKNYNAAVGIVEILNKP